MSDTKPSILELANNFFRVVPRITVSNEEMEKRLIESKERLKNRTRKDTKTAGKEITENSGLSCPKCGMTHWNEFPDGRKMCLKCHYLDEKTDKITCEFLCSGCSKVIQAQGKDIEAAKKKVISHKAYDPSSQCEGVLTYHRQVFPNPEPALILENKKTEKPSMEHEKDSGIIERFQHPKLGKFVCNKCPYLSDCLQRYEDTDTCLKIGMDLKLRKMNELLERFERLLQKLSED